MGRFRTVNKKGGYIVTLKGVCINNQQEDRWTMTDSTDNCKATGKFFNWRGFFSLLLFGSFSLLAFTGIILYVTPKGRVANWTGWTMIGLEKEEWSSVHITLALLVLIASGFHLYYNWGIFWGYIKRRAQTAFNLKLEMALAVLLCLLTFLGTLYGIPPFSTIIQWNDDIKNYWEQQSVAPPMPHAEELSIAELATEVGLSQEEVLALLESAGYKVDDPSITVNDLAVKHGLVPREIYNIIQPQSHTGRGGSGRGMRGGGSGFGGGAVHVSGSVAEKNTPRENTIAPEQNSGQASTPRAGSGMGAGQGAGMGAGQGAGQGMGVGTGMGRNQAGGDSARGYGRMTMQQCCESLSVPLDEGLARLKRAGIEAAGNELLRTIAQRVNKTPGEIAEIIQE
jgi:hypothetical protein